MILSDKDWILMMHFNIYFEWVWSWNGYFLTSINLTKIVCKTRIDLTPSFNYVKNVT
jgi:hypothetical protein